MWHHSHLVPFPDVSFHVPPAPQALEATRKFYAPRKWDCAQAFSVVYTHDYQQPMAIAQVLPSLVGRSYLDVAGLDCAATRNMSPGQQLPLSPMLGTHGIPRGMLIPPGVARPHRDDFPSCAC